jgi:hypothetical protein
MGQGSGIRTKVIPDPDKGVKSHRIADPDPQHRICILSYRIWLKLNDNFLFTICRIRITISPLFDSLKAKGKLT